MTPELGDKVKCKITGLSGIVIARSKYLYGCDRVGVQPPMGADGKLPDAMWGDLDSVEVVQKSVVKGHTEKTEVEKTGGPSLPGQTPTRSDNPR